MLYGQLPSCHHRWMVPSMCNAYMIHCHDASTNSSMQRNTGRMSQTDSDCDHPQEEPCGLQQEDILKWLPSNNSDNSFSTNLGFTDCRTFPYMKKQLLRKDDHGKDGHGKTSFVNRWFHFISNSPEQGNWYKIFYLSNYSNKKETYHDIALYKLYVFRMFLYQDLSCYERYWT